MSDQATIEERRKANREKLRAISEALRAGEPYPGAKFFLWGDSLHYGFWDIKTRGQLSGLYVTICDTEMDGTSTQRSAMRQICKAMTRLYGRREAKANAVVPPLAP